jgi:hypothetical protein
MQCRRKPDPARYAVRESRPLCHVRNGSDLESNSRPQRRPALILISNIILPQCHSDSPFSIGEFWRIREKVQCNFVQIYSKPSHYSCFLFISQTGKPMPNGNQKTLCIQSNPTKMRRHTDLYKIRFFQDFQFLVFVHQIWKWIPYSVSRVFWSKMSLIIKCALELT